MPLETDLLDYKATLDGNFKSPQHTSLLYCPMSENVDKVLSEARKRKMKEGDSDSSMTVYAVTGEFNFVANSVAS